METVVLSMVVMIKDIFDYTLLPQVLSAMDVEGMYAAVSIFSGDTLPILL